MAPVPAQDPLSRPVLGQPVYATHGNRIFRLEPDQGNWHELAATPDVRGRPTWIGQAWFGRNDFFPYARAELKAYDPRGAGLMQALKDYGEADTQVIDTESFFEMCESDRFEWGGR